MTYIPTMESATPVYQAGISRALEALREGNTLVIATLDRLGRSTVNMLALSEELRERCQPAGA